MKACMYMYTVYIHVHVYSYSGIGGTLNLGGFQQQTTQQQTSIGGGGGIITGLKPGSLGTPNTGDVHVHVCELLI